jgi:aspartyl-tRNA(Asn)/glutamyl-tRNA(Gln) amidotransferase subunit A
LERGGCAAVVAAKLVAPKAMTDLAFISLAAAGELLRARRLSPVEYTQALLDRMARLDGRYHAFIRPTPERAIAAARQAETEIMAGRWRGPLHGVPFGLKDIIDVADLPTTAHSRVLIDNVATADAPVAARLKAAGAVMMGKLATHEFAIGGPSFDLPWPPAVNPWGSKHFPGGSSSGSGVALAAGMLPAALGTDTGGSVRNPASMCGISGMKPTYGLVSRRGVFPLSTSLDHVGPMTRCVRDNALLLQIIAGHDQQDAASAEVEVADYTADLEAGVKGLKIAVIRHFYTEDMQAHGEQAQAIETASDLLRSLGAHVSEIRLAPLDDYATCARIIIRCEAFAIHRHWLAERPGDYGDLARQRILDGAAVSAADYIDAQRLKARLTRRTLDGFAGIDAALTVSSMDPACRIDDAEACARLYPRQARQPFNVTGQPAIAIPAGFTREGLPLSLQVIGHPFGEAMIYRVARAYERATGWTEHRPPGLTEASPSQPHATVPAAVAAAIARADAKEGRLP